MRIWLKFFCPSRMKKQKSSSPISAVAAVVDVDAEDHRVVADLAVDVPKVVAETVVVVLTDVGMKEAETVVAVKTVQDVQMPMESNGLRANALMETVDQGARMVKTIVLAVMRPTVQRDQIVARVETMQKQVDVNLGAKDQNVVIAKSVAPAAKMPSAETAAHAVTNKSAQCLGTKMSAVRPVIFPNDRVVRIQPNAVKAAPANHSRSDPAMMALEMLPSDANLRAAKLSQKRMALRAIAKTKAVAIPDARIKEAANDLLSTRVANPKAHQVLEEAL
jgi:hypothetical protein